MDQPPVLETPICPPHATDAERLEYVLRKVYWLSAVLGESKPVWIADPRDAQYLNSTADELRAVAAKLQQEGLIAVEGNRATATDTLRAAEPKYRAEVDEALAFIKPSFNEEMRSGHTNM